MIFLSVDGNTQILLATRFESSQTGIPLVNLNVTLDVIGFLAVDLDNFELRLLNDRL